MRKRETEWKRVCARKLKSDTKTSTTQFHKNVRENWLTCSALQRFIIYLTKENKMFTIFLRHIKNLREWLIVCYVFYFAVLMQICLPKQKKREYNTDQVETCSLKWRIHVIQSLFVSLFVLCESAFACMIVENCFYLCYFIEECQKQQISWNATIFTLVFRLLDLNASFRTNFVIATH